MYYLGLLLLIGYFFLTTYNLFWLLNPKVAKLDWILSGCRRQKDIKKYLEDMELPSKVPKDYAPEIRLELYYSKKSRDFRLLMNLLAERSGGLAQSFRILSVFDKHFQRQWCPRDLKVIRKKPLAFETSSDAKISDLDAKSIWVLWNDAVMVSYVAGKVRKKPLEYTVEINPPSEAPIKSFLYHDIPTFDNKMGAFSDDTQSLISGKKSINSEMSDGEFGTAMANQYKYCCRFDGLNDEEDYEIDISIELDGKTITQVSKKVPGAGANQSLKEPGSPKDKKSE